MLKIATLNVGGINNNTEYLNKLVLTHNIVCVQETWATNKNSIKKNIYCLNKRLYFSPARKVSKLGRPSGGLAFIVDNDLKCQVIFKSERVGLINIGDTIIVNVYLPYFDGNQESKLEFEQELAILQEILNRNSGNRVIIVGDMNTDIIKGNFNSVNLLKFLSENNLTLIDIVQTQHTDFTYHKIANNRYTKSWIDHVTCKKIDQKDITFRILESNFNIGDHNADT